MDTMKLWAWQKIWLQCYQDLIIIKTKIRTMNGTCTL